MVIDKTHPLAPYVAVLRNGRTIPLVERIDTDSHEVWRDGGGGPERFDEVRFMPHTPSHLRDFIPTTWLPHNPPN